MYYSSNAGSSWVSIGLAGKSILAVARSGGTMIVGAQQGLYTSTNNGGNWTENGYINFTINALEVGGPTVVATLLDGVLVSTDAGKNWEMQGVGVIGANLQDLAMSGGMLFAACSKGVYVSRTMGATWSEVNGGLGALGVNSLQTYGASLYAGTPRGVWRRSIAEMILSLPEIPVLVSPANSATLQPVSISLRWRSAARADRFHLQVATTSDFVSGIVVDDTSLVDTVKLVSGLQNSTTYYWRVAGRNAAGQGVWSDVWNCRTIYGLPIQVTLVAPMNGEVNVSTSPFLRWRMQAYGDSCHLRVGTDSLLTSNLIVNDSSLTDTARVAGGLLNGSKYFWKVRAKNINGYGPWGSTWHFATIVLVPEAVQLVSPANGALVGTDSVRFRWRQVAGSGIAYAFEIAIDSLLQFRKVDSTVVDTTRSERVLAGQHYWWRVRARNAAGWGPYSPLYRFVVTSDAVEDRDLVPKVFSLEQNYPNPFNPSTRITYGLPKASQVSLTIYSPLGQKVGDLVTGVKEAGFHTVPFDGANLPSGVYFCRMQAEDFVATRKLLLVK
jgi:hypothetical protein